MSNFAADLLPLWSSSTSGESSPADARAPCLVLPGGGVWTFADLTRRAQQFAALLRVLSVEPGDRVLAQVAKSPDAVALYLASLAAGSVYVPLNTAYTTRELDYFIEDAQPKVVVCDPGALESSSVVARKHGARAVSLGCESWNTGEHRSAGFRESSGGALMADVDAPAVPVVPRADQEPAVIVYTSGTTGRSKGAMLTQANLRSNAEVLRRGWQITADDVLVHALPVFHVHGLFVALHPLLLAGATVRFLPKFEVEEVRRQLRGATVLMGVPTFYTRLLEAGFGRADFEAGARSMRLFISGSAPLLAATHREFERRTGHRVLERYGMSETGMITSNPLDGERVAGTVGFALPGVEIRVCERDSGELCAAGEVGVVEVRGPNVFTGYWRQPEKTAAEFREDGFFVTGDLGWLDEDGRLTLVGRDKDLVISGGYNIYPKEVEQVLDAVDGVRESAVIGVPHDDLGEGLVAVLVAEQDALEKEMLETALLRELARFKHPRRFFWVGELPRNAMGKVQKNALRERFSDAYSSDRRDAER